MYWTYWGSSPKIEKASMDGSSPKAIVTDSLGSPSGLTMDYSTQTLYWTDPTLHTLERCSYDGSDRMVISRTVTNPFGITVLQNTLYWGDLENATIYSAPISDPSTTSVVIAGLLYKPLEMHVVSEERQPLGKQLCILKQNLDLIATLLTIYLVTNPCSDNNGGCDYLCLLSSTSAQNYTCHCPNGAYLGEIAILTFDISTPVCLIHKPQNHCCCFVFGGHYKLLLKPNDLTLDFPIFFPSFSFPLYIPQLTQQLQ